MQNIKNKFFIKDINFCYISNLFIDTNNCIVNLAALSSRKYSLLIIRDINNHIAISQPNYYKTISFIT